MKKARSFSNVLFGAAYYDEYQIFTNIDKDFELMKAAQFSVIRVGEGSWTKWEPQDGIYNLEWLEPVLDHAVRNGMKVVIGMPTFALPLWMARKFPELSMKDMNGNVKKFGYREEHSYSHPIFKYYSSRLIEKIVMRYTSHPAVIGWQVYNEPGLHFDYSDYIFEKFKDYLSEKYHSCENLNNKWGLVFWSHELSSWDDLWPPESNGSPQYDLEWRMFQQKLCDELIEWTTAKIKEFASDEQFCTVCISLNRKAKNEATLSKNLDVACSSIYFQMQDTLSIDYNEHVEQIPFSAGAWSVGLQADRSYGIKDRPFYVFETNAGPIGSPADNFPAWKGQLKQIGFLVISRGCSLLEYWHWQTLHFGTETYCCGILPHDRLPGRIYNEIAELGQLINNLGSNIVDLKPDYDVAFLYSEKSRQALAYQPHRADGFLSPHRTRNERSYDEIFESFYLGAFGANKQSKIVHDVLIVSDKEEQWIVDPQDFVIDTPILVVPGLYVCDDTLKKWLETYVIAGGHLILGPKSIYADEFARPTLLRKPSLSNDLCGCYYQEFSNIKENIPVASFDKDHSCIKGAIRDWFEYLIPTKGKVIAYADHEHLREYGVIVQNKIGDGIVTTFGAIPDKSLSESFFSSIAINGKALSCNNDKVTVSSATNKNGEKIVFLFNFNSNKQLVTIPKGYRLISAENESAAFTKELLPWDVLILIGGCNNE